MTNKELTDQVKHLRGLLSVCEERADHFRTEARRLAGENEQLARRNAVLVADRDAGPTGDEPDELEITTSDGSGINWMTKDCPCHGRMAGVLVNTSEIGVHIFEIQDRKILRDISKWAANAASWIGESDANKPRN